MLQDKKNKRKLLSTSNLKKDKLEIDVFETENCSNGDIDRLKDLLNRFIDAIRHK